MHRTTPEALTPDSPDPGTKQLHDPVHTRYRSAVVRGVRVFYREAGSPSKPTLVLLHGFPSSSHMFRELLVLLANDFHLIAPDYPGAGFSDAPPASLFAPSFENLADLMSEFTQQIGLSSFVLYMQDFGGPVGLRMALKHPERIQGLVVQNANAYMEGIAPQQLQGILSPTLREVEKLVSRDFTLFMYRTGARDFDAMDPTGWNVDLWVLQNSEARRIQTSLMMDYHSNVSQYPRWQSYLRDHSPKTLILWGRHDGVFLPAGAEAYLRDLPEARLQLFDTGHFALEEDASAIANEIRAYFDRR
jgi:pimeloyl-ACP methyl ester carboxylesterase